ncbi:MAG: AMP-binding protein [Pseudomonadota bacterium]
MSNADDELISSNRPDWQVCRNLPEILSLQAEQRPQDTALWWQGRATNYRQLQSQVEHLARRLSHHGQPGERVAVLAWNRPEFLDLMYAVPTAGQILVPLNARLAPRELLYQLTTSGSTTLFADTELLSRLQRTVELPDTLEVIDLDAEYSAWLEQEAGVELPVLDGSEGVWILFTSGSTGRPKGAVLTHNSFLAGLRSAALGRPVRRCDRYLYPFPLFHVAAHNVMLQHLSGASVVLQASFKAEATLTLCRELGVTTMSLAPTMMAMLLDHPDYQPQDLATVRSIGYGASAMPEGLLRRFINETDIDLCQSYGMTELSGSVSFLTPEDHRLAALGRPELLRAVGKPLPTARVKIVDEQGNECSTGSRGEILVCAAQTMAGYWGDSEATQQTLQEGWLHTGDIGLFDEQGYLYVVDRKKDMIISGGENIASREIEEALRSHEALSDCAVIGVPDQRWGETICAVVELRRKASDAELEAHCRSLLAGFKVPRHWLRVDALPVNAGGKVDKPALRALYQQRSIEN